MMIRKLVKVLKTSIYFNRKLFITGNTFDFIYWNAAVNIALRGKHHVSSARTPLNCALATPSGRARSTTKKHVNPHLAWSCKPSTI